MRGTNAAVQPIDSRKAKVQRTEKGIDVILSVFRQLKRAFIEQDPAHERSPDLSVEASSLLPESYHLFASVTIADARICSVTRRFPVWRRFLVLQQCADSDCSVI